MDLFHVFSIVGLVLGVVSTALHAIAPLTKTKVDDKMAEGVDFVKDKVMPAAGSVLPSAAKPDAGKVVGFGNSEARDHRAK